MNLSHFVITIGGAFSILVSSLCEWFSSFPFAVFLVFFVLFFVYLYYNWGCLNHLLLLFSSSFFYLGLLSGIYCLFLLETSLVPPFTFPVSSLIVLIATTNIFSSFNFKLSMPLIFFSVFNKNQLFY